MKKLIIVTTLISGSLYGSSSMDCDNSSKINFNMPLYEDPQAALTHAVQSNDITTALILLQEQEAQAHEALLLIAIQKNALEMAALLITKGAIKNVRPLLYKAVEQQNTDMVRLLAAYGADVNKATPTRNTPLHLAAWLGNLHLVKILLEADADKTLTNNDGNTPEDVARQQGNYEVANFIKHHNPKKLQRESTAKRARVC